MASQAYIHNSEAAVIVADELVAETQRAFEYECKLNEPEGGPYYENNVSWCQLRVALIRLRQRIDATLEQMETATEEAVMQL